MDGRAPNPPDSLLVSQLVPTMLNFSGLKKGILVRFPYDANMTPMLVDPRVVLFDLRN
jgi:hypothetical protein